MPEPFWKTVAPDVHHEITEYLFDQVGESFTAGEEGMDGDSEAEGLGHAEEGHILRKNYACASGSPPGNRPYNPCNPRVTPVLRSQDQDQSKYIRAMLEAVQARRRTPWGVLPGTAGSTGAPGSPRRKRGAAAATGGAPVAGAGAGGRLAGSTGSEPASASVALVATVTRIMLVGADR